MFTIHLVFSRAILPLHVHVRQKTIAQKYKRVQKECALSTNGKQLIFTVTNSVSCIWKTWMPGRHLNIVIQCLLA